MNEWKTDIIKRLVTNNRTITFLMFNEYDRFERIAHSFDVAAAALKELVGYMLVEPVDAYYRVDENDFVLLFKKEGMRLEVEISSDGFSVKFEETDNGFSGETRFMLDEYYRVLNYIKVFGGDTSKKAVLFSGTFNPPTAAHDFVIQSACEDIGGYVIIAACNGRYLRDKIKKRKWNGGGDECMMLAEQTRIELLVKMTYKNDRVLIYGIEDGYTYDVLCNASERFGIKDMYFAMGSDKIGQVMRWGNHKKLLAQFRFYVTGRGEDETSIRKKWEKTGASDVTYLVNSHDGSRFFGVSATEIRKRIARGADYSDLVTEDVGKMLKTIQKDFWKDGGTMWIFYEKNLNMDGACVAVMHKSGNSSGRVLEVYMGRDGYFTKSYVNGIKPYRVSYDEVREKCGKGVQDSTAGRKVELKQACRMAEQDYDRQKDELFGTCL